MTSLDSGYLLSKNVILFDHTTHAIQCWGTHTSQAAKLCNLSGGTPTHAPSSTILLLLFNSNKYFIILALFLSVVAWKGSLRELTRLARGLRLPASIPGVEKYKQQSFKPTQLIEGSAPRCRGAQNT